MYLDFYFNAAKGALGHPFVTYIAGRCVEHEYTLQMRSLVDFMIKKHLFMPSGHQG